MIFARDVAAVAAYEIGEGLRTRLFAVATLGYGAAIGASVWLFTRILLQMENAAAAGLGIPATERPGAMVGTLRDQGALVDLLTEIAGSAENARALADEPLIALWTGAATMLLLPALTAVTAGGSVAEEVRTRSIRYLLVRVGRLPIGLGKLVGQFVLATIATTIGGTIAWILGMTLMVGNPPLALAVALADRCAWGLASVLPFLAIALSASMIVPNPHGARLFAVGALVLEPIAFWWLTRASGVDLPGRLADFATLLLPSRLSPGFWVEAEQIYSLGGSLLLGAIWFTAGFALFERRNL